MDKLIGRSKRDLQDLQHRIRARYTDRAPIFGNRVSIAMANTVSNIEVVLTDEENFSQCDICQEYKYKGDIKEDFEGGLDVCIECQEEKYHYCEECGDPIYYEDPELHIIDDTIYCEECYFIVKDRIITDWKINDKRIQALNRLLKIKKLPVSYDTIKDYDFIIKGFNFSVESHFGFYRLGSWSANFWIDLCTEEKDLLKAIDYITETNLETISDIRLS